MTTYTFKINAAGGNLGLDVSPETEYSYVDKSNGHAVSFTPKPDEVMLTFQGRATQDTLDEVVDAAPLFRSARVSTWNAVSLPST